MDKSSIISAIEQGQTALGIEFGSTRIKAVLVAPDSTPIASGGFGWENRFENGVWTYHDDEIWTGLQACYAELSKNVSEKYGVELNKIGAIGFSAMMHGYLAFDKADNLLVPFRTWRNTITGDAARELTELFGFNIPQRWSIAHLYQAILNGEQHVKDVAFITTLAGYVHYRLTGEKILGIGDASGVFPIDSATNDYDETMVNKFDALIGGKFNWRLRDILPRVLSAGEPAGALTAEGAKLLDASGRLKAGIPFCPTEGDAGTGMVATNSVAQRTGNVSAGTSVFAMLVLERPLSRVYPEIDMVTTPTGKPVAMVHCNNCSSDIDAWVKLFGEAAATLGEKVSTDDLYIKLFNKALEGDADCGGLMNFNYFSGEHITRVENGRPLFVRTPESAFTLANFMRVQLNSALATLKLGLDILFDNERVELDSLLGHGGYFKTKGVGQRLMAAAVNTPVTVMETAGEGGAWGIAILAEYLRSKADGQTLEAYLSEKVFAANPGVTVSPDPKDVMGFAGFMQRFRAALPVEQAASAKL